MAPRQEGLIPPKSRPVAPSSFSRDTREVAKDLLGKVLVSTVDGEITAGRIVETEAYLGSEDPGSHAATKGMTSRNAVMYGPPGTVYVYFTYGCHHMLNLVTREDGVAGAVLIRALEPLAGTEVMRRRRGGAPDANLANGPGKLAQALGVDLTDNGTLLGQGRLEVFDDDYSPAAVCTSGRIGLSAGHEVQLRFFIEASPSVSRGRTGPRRPKNRS